jgi:SAM-dependent methyltransferase
MPFSTSDLPLSRDNCTITMRVLDLGCGVGLTPQKLGLPSDWQFIGLDVAFKSVSEAHLNFRHRPFVCAAAEHMPFRDSSFDQVISNVALPYTNIPKALAESYRVLVPGGVFIASLHHAGFTLAELRHALPRPQAVLFRLWVILNGIVFHLSGRTFGESFQTERGIRIALRRAHFADVRLRRDAKRWFVEAAKPPNFPGTLN